MFYLDDAPCTHPCGLKGICGHAVRLGTGTAVGVAAGESITESAALAGPAAPVVAAVGAVVSLISEFFGGGCGAACTESAELEQVPEVALDDLQAVAQSQPGAVSSSMFEEAYNAIIQYGEQQLTALAQKGDSKASGGLTNLQNSTNYSSFIASLPEEATVALDVDAAETTIDGHATTGWYAASVEAGNQLALQVVQSWAGGGSSSITGVLSSLSTSTGLPEWAILAGGAALLYFLF